MEDEELSPNTKIGPYEVIREVGRGGMGRVYEVRHTALGKRAALKVLPAQWAKHDVTLERFLREGRAASRVHHPHVVDIYDAGSEAGMPYLAMEFLEGEDLAAKLKRDAPLGVEEAVDTFLPVLSAMAAVHRTGIVHRDLKPSNIFLARESTGTCPKVLDFGISKTNESFGSKDMTDSSMVLGTLHYMAPEQARGARQATELSDQYALGVILYECLTGECPFDGESPYEILHAIMTEPVVEPRRIVETIPRDVEAVVLRAMDRAPERRYRGVEDLGRCLFAFASPRARLMWEGEFGGGLPQEPAPPFIEGRRKHAVSAVLGAACLMAIGGWSLVRSKAPSLSAAPSLGLRTPAREATELGTANAEDAPGPIHVQSAPISTAPALTHPRPLPAVTRPERDARLPRVAPPEPPAGKAVTPVERGTNRSPIVE